MVTKPTPTPPRKTSTSKPTTSNTSIRTLQDEVKDLKSQVVSLTQDINTICCTTDCLEVSIDKLAQQGQANLDVVLSKFQELIASVNNATERSSSVTTDHNAAEHNGGIVPAPRKYLTVMGERKACKVPIRKPHILNLVIKPTQKQMSDVTALALYSNIRHERAVALESLAERLKIAAKNPGTTEQCQRKESSEDPRELQVEQEHQEENEDADEAQLSENGEQDQANFSESEEYVQDDEMGEAMQSDEEPSEKQYNEHDETVLEDGEASESEEDDGQEDMNSRQHASGELVENTNGECARQDPTLVTWGSVLPSQQKITILAFEASVLEVVKIDLSNCEEHWAAYHILEEGWNNRYKTAVSKGSKKRRGSTVGGRGSKRHVSAEYSGADDAYSTITFSK